MKRKIDLSVPNALQNAANEDKMSVFWAKTDDSLELFLYGVVGDEYTESDAGSISRVLAQHKNHPVTLRINSGGGLAFDGLAIYNALADHPAPTTAVIESLAASAASLAAIGADRVLMYDNAVYHIHEGLAIGFGHIADLRETIDWLEKFNAAAVDTYAAKTGKSKDLIAQALLGANGDGTKYNAQDALDFGFVDEVITAGKKKQKKQPKAQVSIGNRLKQQRLQFEIEKLRLM